MHSAATSKAPPEVVEWILDLCPKLTKGRDSWGRTPLWRACNEPEIDPDVLMMLMNPIDVHVADRSGQTCLHAAVSNNTPIEMIATILRAAPDTIRIRDKQGRLPFHACASGGFATIERLQFLLDAYPESIKAVDKNGSLALHLLCKRKAEPDILAFLMEEYPDSVRAMELISGAYPFHFACAAGLPLEVLNILYQAYPEAATQTDREGNTVLHLICEKRPSVELLDFVVDIHPEAVSIPNKRKNLPLHVAAANRATWPVFERLIELHRPAVWTINGRGRLPIHDGFRVKLPNTTLVRFAQIFPPGLDLEDDAGKVPEEYTTEFKAKEFDKARFRYNMRHAWCPCCIFRPKE